ncbi:transposase [Prevotella sp. S7 MS 2]|uniref:transposase n=1 Tax=Prevotella sp. S7 MS 2 TaxID=1287488 RepID=UPI002100BCC4|nr:transposase [Prevotella sp. S7 MS 2]
MRKTSKIRKYRNFSKLRYFCFIQILLFRGRLEVGKVEGINNKIKVMKRNAYGFKDERYFTLRLYALHDCRITRNVG